MSRIAGIAVSVTLIAVVGCAQPGNAPTATVNGLEGPTRAKGFVPERLGGLDLKTQIEGMQGRELRTRRVTIKPGGIAPVHGHRDRPAMLYVVTGEIVEHRSDSSAPITRRGGDLSLAEDGVAHWWENTGQADVVILATDVFNKAKGVDDENPCNPCGGKKAMNPCNPCGGKRAMNPCNPCGGSQGETRTLDGLTGPTASEGVSVTVLGSIPLEKEIPGMGNRRLRTRLWTIQPGGVVPIHTHADRPAMIYVLEGTINEHRSDRATPVAHQPGDLSIEADLAHWWENKGKEPVRLVATDIVHDK